MNFCFRNVEHNITHKVVIQLSGEAPNDPRKEVY